MQVYRAEKDLSDVDALDAVEALIRHYSAEENGRRPPEQSGRVFAWVKDMCEWRLGRGELGAVGGDPPLPPITVPELVRCLRRTEFVSQYEVRAGEVGQAVSPAKCRSHRGNHSAFG